MTNRNLILAGVATWFIVGVPNVIAGAGAVWAICFVTFLLLFLIAVRETSTGWKRHLLVGAQSIVALVCVLLEPRGFQPVLLVIVATELGHLRPLPALSWVAAQSVILGPILVRGTDRGVAMTLAYFGFQLFGFFAARVAHEEREARQALAQANAELRVATGLLEMSSRSEERLRIARDLHDLIGHHLTALTLNLEVASHLTDGQAREQIEKSRTIAKLLLSDVRDVVGRLREGETVDLGAALAALREVVPSPVIHIDAGGVSVAEPIVARTALRAVQEIVTNAVRHSGARNLWLKVAANSHDLTVEARDDGGGTDRVVYGNGLRGMRERVQQAGGTLEVTSMPGRGFEVHVRLPLGGAT